MSRICWRSCASRKPARPRRGVPPAAAAARRRPGARRSASSTRSPRPPTRSARCSMPGRLAPASTGTAFVDMVRPLRDGEARWPAELERARLWYEPHLDRLHEDAAAAPGRSRQLEQIAAGYRSRGHFLTELTLDPPDATSDRGRRAAARRGLSDSLDDPFRQGTGMEIRLRAECRRRLHPFRSRHRHGGRDRGGAASALCRDDAGQRRSAPDRRRSASSPTARTPRATAMSMQREAGSSRPNLRRCSKCRPGRSPPRSTARRPAPPRPDLRRRREFVRGDLARHGRARDMGERNQRIVDRVGLQIDEPGFERPVLFDAARSAVRRQLI